MILRAEQIFDKVYLDRERPSDFIEFVADDQAEMMREAYELKDLKTRNKPFKSVWVDENFNELGGDDE